MTTKHRYTYTILRYVHDVVTGEFVNVGIVMHSSDTGYIRSEVRSTIGRIKNVFPDFGRQEFLRAVKHVQKRLNSYGRESGHGDLFGREINAATIARRAIVSDDSSFQWAPVSGGITADMDQTFERLYSRFVSRYDQRTSNRRSDDEIWRPVRQMLEARRVPVIFEEKTISGEADEISFKRAWKNGSWHAYEPLSFDLADADGIKDKARRWRGHLEAVREGVTEGLSLHFIVGAPQNRSLISAYIGALKILESSPFEPKIYEESEIPELVDEIEDEVRDHLSA